MVKTKEKQKPIKIFTLDTETRGLNGSIFKLGLYSVDEKTGEDQYWEKNDFIDFIKILRRYSLTYDVHIYIHNLDFDLGKTAEYFMDEFIWNESLIINNRPAILKTFYFTFHDSLQLLGNDSLDKLCKDFDVKNKKIDLVEKLSKDPEYRKYLSWDDGRKRNLINIEEYKQLNKCTVDPNETKNKFFYYVPADDPLLLEYLKYDCVSLYEILEKVHEASGLKLDKFIKCPTIANMSMRIFETNFPDQAEQTHTTQFLMGEEGKEAENFLRSAYHGGRTELFKNRLENGFSFDVTSLYPFSMREWQYPVGQFFMKGATMAETVWESFCEGERIGGVLEATVFIPKGINPQNIPPLPFNCEKRGKLLFPVGKIRGSWTFPELKFAVDRGVKILEFHRVIWFEKMSSIFIGFVNFFEKLKNEHTEHIPKSGLNKEGRKVNPSMRAFAKLVLNALYGKFGSRRENKSFISLDELPALVKKWTYAKNKRIKQKKRFLYEDSLEFFKLVLEHGIEEAENLFDPENDQDKIMPLLLPNEDYTLFQFNSYSEAKFIQVQISAYITSYARMHLYRGFEEIWKKGGLVYYCDTDSIYSDVRLPDHMVDSSTFGKWKLEKENISGLFVQEKSYIVDNEPKMKGFKKSFVKNNMDQEFFENVHDHQIKQDIEYLPVVVDEHEEYQLTKFMTAIKNGDSFNKMNLIVKGLYFRQEENKRKMDYENNSSDPWEYDGENEKEIDQYIEETDLEAEEDWAWTNWEKVLEVTLKEKVKIPNRNTKAYSIYRSLDPKLKRLYFSSKAKNDLAELCETAEWNIEDVLMELETTTMYY